MIDPLPMVQRVRLAMIEPVACCTLDVAAAARHYRAIWRGCLLAGSIGLLTVVPLIAAAQVDLEVAAGGSRGAGVREALERGAAPSSWLAWTIIAISLGCVLCVGRFSPRRVIAGTVLLIAGAGLVVSDDWVRIENGWKSSEWDIATVYSIFETGVWLACALNAAVALLLLAAVQAAPGRARILSEMLSFERLGRKRQKSHRTYRISRLLWMVVGLVATMAMAIVLHLINGLLLRQHVLGIPADLHRDLEAQRVFVETHPVISVISALQDLIQIVLTIVLGTIILRFFWRLVVADAKRLLDDPNYRPIVFLRSFSDEGATVTSKRLFDRLVRRRRRLEEIAVSALRPLGAAIAIGQPGERLPKLGAIRAYYPDDQWQAAVLEWMRRAQLIVLVGGASHWTLWELRQAIDLGYHGKILLVLPPDRDPVARNSRAAALAGAVAGTLWEEDFRALQSAGLLVTVLKSDARALPIKGNTRLQSDHEAALRLAVVEMFTSAARSADPPAARAFRSPSNGTPATDGG
jgi:hypothetical protein